MKNQPSQFALLAGLFLGILPPVASATGSRAPSNAIDFNRDIRPILANHCYSCHGPDSNKRKAGLRLDVREDALRALPSGGAAILPGNRSKSRLYERIAAKRERERMPPRSTGKSLSPAEIELLGRWIDEGARWAKHWAYVSPRRTPPPTVKNKDWPRNPVDHFILARLEKEKLQPSPEADRVTLLRRVSLDLTGLPPTIGEVEAFLADKSPNAYEKVVERLLASPHYGERMAQPWLDLARYADTNGYRLDNHRDVWKYRDWVIGAFNANMPFDQFTVEQLAGDLLPHATREQKIATGFNRNTMVNFGNGSNPKEYLAKAVMDRVSTTATVWLGTTLGCAQCHDHKYDPFSQKDFYRFYAFFNNVPEKGLDGAHSNPVPSILAPSPEQEKQLADLRGQLARLDARIKTTGKSPALLKKHAHLKKAEGELLAAVPAAMVMEEMPQPRVTRVLIRGDFLSEGEVVTAGVPADLLPWPAGAPANRLGLAQWLTDPRHPLTARVTVNRFWQMLFGAGLVKTSDDFGAQGELPSHPELLDWLATEFIDRKWDVKGMLKLIVTSATYRQSSHTSRLLQEKDPHNRLLARGARVRLDAEAIRDNALAISGLLRTRIGGPSVRPYQPVGLWEQIAVGGDYSSQKYVQSKGDDLYRRGLYTYWKRSLPYPALATFDAPTRELCTALRPRTNTPLQALVLLNDPTYLEAARVLAQRVLTEGSAGFSNRVGYAFKLCTGRTPTAREVSVLKRVYQQRLADYREDHKAAEELVGVGESKRPAGLEVSELAAWTTVANLLLNLDETITKE
jgi:hypothetical protein